MAPEEIAATEWLDLDAMTDTRLGMSNFDREIDDGLDEALRADPNAYGHHYAWGFEGFVTFRGGKFREEVWIYGSPVRALAAETLGDLLNDVNQEYGWQ